MLHRKMKEEEEERWRRGGGEVEERWRRGGRMGGMEVGKREVEVGMGGYERV